MRSDVKTSEVATLTSCLLVLDKGSAHYHQHIGIKLYPSAFFANVCEQWRGTALSVVLQNKCDKQVVGSFGFIHVVEISVSGVRWLLLTASLRCHLTSYITSTSKAEPSRRDCCSHMLELSMKMSGLNLKTGLHWRKVSFRCLLHVCLLCTDHIWFTRNMLHDQSVSATAASMLLYVWIYLYKTTFEYDTFSGESIKQTEVHAKYVS